MDNTLEVNDDQLNMTLDALFGDTSKQLDWQRMACANAARSAFSVITGGPGTGKTYTVELSCCSTAATISTSPWKTTAY